MSPRGVATPLLVAALAVAALAAPGCHEESCLTGACPRPCLELAFTCAAQPLYAGPVANAPAAYRLTGGAGASGDTLISNGRITAVISDPATQLDLAPTGGSLVDLGPAGGADDVALVYQLAGLLPDDAFAYDTLEVTRPPDRVTVTVRGALDGRPDVRVVTHYELGACDPGVRVRSELWNGSPDVQAFLIADASHWGKRRVMPFVPARDQGYAQPELDLLELTALWQGHALHAAAGPAPASPGYAAVACGRARLFGVNDLEISALGTPMVMVEPGATLVHERLLVAAGAGQGPAPAIDAALAARAQLFPTPTATITGRIVAAPAGGAPAPLGGDVRRASIVITAGGVPVSAVVPGADGRFTATVLAAAGPLALAVWSFGRVVAEVPVPDAAGGAGGRDVGDVAIEAPGTLAVAVTRAGAPIHALVALHPADDATRAAVTGTLHGRLTPCAPWLGPPHGGSPACNQLLVAPAGAEVEVPAGRYVAYASAGPAHTLARAQLEIVAGETTPLALAVTALPLAPPGWLSADLHVHGRASFDSGFPDEDRVRSFAAAGVDVIAATDHDVVGDYADTVARLGLGGEVAVMGGLEATQVIPWLDIPGEDLPRVIGHFNAWPLRRVPGAPNGGAPSDEGLHPGELFDRLEPLVGPAGVMMMNHPWDEPTFGRDLGYLRAIEFDPRKAIDDPTTPNGALLERPGGRHRNADWDVIEILNGADQVELQKARILWHALLAQGLLAAGAGNSDSHGMLDAQLGWARNWVDAGTTVAAFDPAAFNAAVRQGRMVAGNGIVIVATVGPPGGPRRGVSLVPYVPGPTDTLAITVTAPPWVPVEEVRLVTSRGTRVIAAGAQLARPPDPFGTEGVVRYQATLPLWDLVDRDDFVIVEAGLPFPDAADLDDDGVPDTTDNDGDGVIDARDVEDGEDAGPFAAAPDPTDPADPRFLVTRVVPGAWPMAFTNPLIIDLDGSGWRPPGLAP